MAAKEEEVVVDYGPTWQDKLDNGQTLNPLEETKADADFNYKQRLAEQKARAEFEARKAGGLRPAAAPAKEQLNSEGDK
jgi:hypothetical protein